MAPMVEVLSPDMGGKTWSFRPIIWSLSRKLPPFLQKQEGYLAKKREGWGVGHWRRQDGTAVPKKGAAGLKNFWLATFLLKFSVEVVAALVKVMENRLASLPFCHRDSSLFPSFIDRTLFDASTRISAE
ncbi:MAG: hypothetical protein MPJ24_05775 [Pirellulaceae bacterium]|nr:hypothetical protein [Pirellulaceae bacterium]